MSQANEVFNIETIDQFAALITAWHTNRIGQVRQAIDVPADVDVEIVLQDGGEAIVLNEEQRIGFKAALVLVDNLLGTLPFNVTPIEPATDAGPSAESADATQPQPALEAE